MTKPQTFIVDRLAGVLPGSSLDLLLSERNDVRLDVQAGYDRLIEPPFASSVSLLERHAVAAFVAALRGEPETTRHFEQLLGRTDPTRGRLQRVILAEARGASRLAPYGSLTGDPARAEALDGPPYAASADVREVIGDRLAAALEYAHLVFLHPADATEASLEKLRKAGWTDEDHRVLEEIVAFLGVHIRLVAGLRAVIAAKQAESPAAPDGEKPARRSWADRFALPVASAPRGYAWFHYGY